MEKEAIKILSSQKCKLFLLTVITILLYSRTLTHQYVWDDKTFANWNLTRDFKYIRWFFKGALPDTHIGDYRPLKGIILILDHYFLGDNQIAYRAQAIGIHLIAVVLVYLLTKEVTAKPDIAFFTSLLFAVHPVQVEAIAFFTSSTDIVGVLFFLLSFCAFIRWDRKKHRYLLLFSTLMWTLAILSYEMTLIMPLLTTFYVLMLSSKNSLSWRSVLKFQTPYIAVLGCYLLVRIGILHLNSGETYLAGSFYTTMLVMIKVVGKYLWLLLFPVHLSVNHEISPGIFAQKDVDFLETAARAQSLFDPSVIISLLSITCLIVFAIFCYKKYPYYTFCIGWFFVSLLPVMNIIPLSALMGERYIYIASIGWCLLLGVWVDRLLTWPKSLRTKYILFSLVLLVVGVFTLRSWVRLGDWQNSVTLWNAELSQSPESTLAHHNLGVGYVEQGKPQEALKHFEYAAAHNSTRIPKISYNLALNYLRLERREDAEKELKRTLTIDPNYIPALIELGTIYLKEDRFSDAEHHYRKAIEIDQYSAEAHYRLAALFIKMNRLSEAKGELEEVLRLNTLYMPAYYELSALYLKEGNISSSRSILENAYEKDPHSESINQALRLLEESNKN